MTDADRAVLDQCLAESDARQRRLVAASPIAFTAEYDQEFTRWLALMRARYDPHDDGVIRCAVCRWPYAIVRVRGRIEYVDVLQIKNIGTVDHAAPEHACPVVPPTASPAR